MRTRLLSVLASVIVVVVAATPSIAGPINAGFETGNFNGWSTFGQTSVLTNATFAVTPTEGHFQALLTTGGNAGSTAGLESFLGLSAGAISTLVGQTAFQGSAIKQTFSANPGEKISFNWNFLTNECPTYCGSTGNPPNFFNDTSFAIVSVLYSELGDTHAKLFPAPGTGFNGQTGYQSFTTGPLIGGPVTLAFGVVDVGDSIFDSALAVDAAVVPEPATLLLFGTTMAGLGLARWRRRKLKQAAGAH